MTGDEAAIGKPVGSDERNHKSTYVTLFSLERAQQMADEAVERAVAALATFGGEAEFLRELVRFLRDRKQ